MTIHWIPQNTSTLETTDRPTGARAGKPSKAKPYNGDAGYRCSRRTPFGHAVVYDREAGGEWITDRTRWMVAAYDCRQRNIGLLECESERDARTAMKEAAAGDCGWCDWIGHLQLGQIPEDMHVRCWTRTATGYAIACERDGGHEGSKTPPWVVRLVDDSFRPTGARKCESLEAALAVFAMLDK